MKKFEEESIGFDDTFEIECVIYEMLEKTISKAIDKELKKDGTPPLLLSKDIMLKNILSRNIDGLEEQQYMTVGPEGKTYLCGSWLMRSVLNDDGSYISTMEYIKAKADCTNIVFLPNKTGIDLRKELWFAKNKDYTSYSLPKDCRLALPDETVPPVGMSGEGPFPAGAGGPPPGAFGGSPLSAPDRGPVSAASSSAAGGQVNLHTVEALIDALKKTIAGAIKDTVSHSVDTSMEKDKISSHEDKDMIIQGIVARNLAEMEEGAYVFEVDNTVYVCGDWLLRQISVGPEKMPLIARLKQQFYQYENIVYRPDIRGKELLSQMRAS